MKSADNIYNPRAFDDVVFDVLGITPASPKPKVFKRDYSFSLLYLAKGAW
ncbi:MAG: hypothetical protein ABIK42_00550 [candidate division WOR-3 bacterium]